MDEIIELFNHMWMLWIWDCVMSMSRLANKM